MRARGTVSFPRKFAGFRIVMELESVLWQEQYVPFCRHFSNGNFGSSLTMRKKVGET